MIRELDFSPVVFIKEANGSVNSAIVVDNGPCLMEEKNDDEKQYTEVFNNLIEKFTSILTVAFYGKKYTSYKIKIEGEDLASIIKIKKFITDIMEEE